MNVWMNNYASGYIITAYTFSLPDFTDSLLLKTREGSQYMGVSAFYKSATNIAGRYSCTTHVGDTSSGYDASGNIQIIQIDAANGIYMGPVSSTLGMYPGNLLTSLATIMESDDPGNLNPQTSQIVRDQVLAYFTRSVDPPLYVGVNEHARQVTDMYVGVNGKAREVTALYVGVNGKARKVFPIDPSSYATVTIKGGKEDKIKIFDGVTLLKTVIFETDKISKKVKLPTNKLLTFTSTKFKYGDDNTYFSKNATIVENCTIKVMPEGALYWYGNECEDLTGGWEIHNVEHHTYHGTSSGFSTLTAPIEKNKNSIYAGWDSDDLSQVPTTYYYMSSIATKNAVNYQHSTVKIHIKNSNAVKEITNTQYGVLLGCGYSTASSGAVYWNISFGSGNAIDYPNNNAGSNNKSNFYLSGSDSSTNVYFSALLSVYANGSNSRQYGNIEFDYFVLE